MSERLIGLLSHQHKEGNRRKRIRCLMNATVRSGQQGFVRSRAAPSVVFKPPKWRTQHVCAGWGQSSAQAVAVDTARTVQKEYIAEVVHSIEEVDAAEWDTLAAACSTEYSPFTSHTFLSILEASHSAVPEEGWGPHHIVVRERPHISTANGFGGSNHGNHNSANATKQKGKLIGAIPLYVKSHSYGEYVFDDSWSKYASMLGQRYYPKLQACIPFTPVPGPRLLTAAPPGSSERPDQLRALGSALKSIVGAAGVSSAHVTFNTAEEAAALEELGFLTRCGIQFHWENAGYKSWADFEAALKQPKRKSIRQERKSITKQGLRVRRLSGDALREEGDKIWEVFYQFYMDTVDRKWGTAYLTQGFFTMLGRRMADQVLLVVAEEETREGSGQWRIVAAALNLIGSHALFGRNWGCEPGRPFQHLHFELCYYSVLEEAIARGLPRVEAGAQGEHKLQRGYLPSLTFSSHWIQDPMLRHAISIFLGREREAVARTWKELTLQSSPYKVEHTLGCMEEKIRHYKSSLDSLSSSFDSI